MDEIGFNLQAIKDRVNVGENEWAQSCGDLWGSFSAG